jgi:hypothetical protein
MQKIFEKCFLGILIIYFHTNFRIPSCNSYRYQTESEILILLVYYVVLHCQNYILTHLFAYTPKIATNFQDATYTGVSVSPTPGLPEITYRLSTKILRSKISEYLYVCRLMFLARYSCKFRYFLQ